MSRILEWCKKHPQAKSSLIRWCKLVEGGNWTQYADVVNTFGSAVDRVKADSGRPVIVFDIHGNHFRLLAAIHYNHKRVYAMRLLTHADYSDDDWKEQL